MDIIIIFVVFFILATSSTNSPLKSNDEAAKLKKFLSNSASSSSASGKVNRNYDEYDDDGGEMYDEDDDEEDIWKNFDVGTLDFNKFIEITQDGDESSQRQHNAPTTSHANTTAAVGKGSVKGAMRKKRKDANSDDDLAEIRSKRRVILMVFRF